MDGNSETEENTEKDPDDFDVRAEHPDLGHVYRSQDAYLIEQRVDENTLDCIKVKVCSVLTVF